MSACQSSLTCWCVPTITQSVSKVSQKLLWWLRQRKNQANNINDDLSELPRRVSFTGVCLVSCGASTGCSISSRTWVGFTLKFDLGCSTILHGCLVISTGCSISSRTWVGFTLIWDVPPSCMAAWSYLPKSHLPRQNRAESGTPKIKGNPTNVRALMEHPVLLELMPHATQRNQRDKRIKNSELYPTKSTTPQQ